MSLHAGEFFILFSENSLRNTIRVSNSLDPDQDRDMSVLILVQTVCKGYQQMTKIITSKRRYTSEVICKKKKTA